MRNMRCRESLILFVLAILFVVLPMLAAFALPAEADCCGAKKPSFKRFNFFAAAADYSEGERDGRIDRWRSEFNLLTRTMERELQDVYKTGKAHRQFGNGEVDKGKLLSFFVKAMQATGPDELTVVYVLFHGTCNESGDGYKLYCGPGDYFSGQDLGHIFKEAKGPTIFILNSCHSGAIIRDWKAVGVPGHVLVLPTSRADQVAWEWGLAPHVAEGLSGAADRDKDGQTTVEELFRYAQGQLVEGGYPQIMPLYHLADSPLKDVVLGRRKR